MEDKIKLLKDKITLLASNKEFIHHKWFIKWHLEIVENFSLELCEIYKEADKDLVLLIVWLHDYSKIIDFVNEHNSSVLRKSKPMLTEIGFDQEFIEKTYEYIDIFENKMIVDLSFAPLEVKIVSSADAASHMVGPFYSLYWYENSQLSIDDLLRANIKKLEKDWNRKIVLPEVKDKFEKFYNLIRIQSGEIPKNIFSDKD